MPRPRPPFPAQEGLHGKPTNINNVETLANVPAIMEHGSEWFARHGTDKSRGTKTFALAGKIVRTGLIEVPLGISLGEIVFEIGGGIPGNKKIKAVQTGGPSGGCIPAKLLDMPVDYEKLAAAGAIMGSGGMVVMDEDTCMVDIARYFVEFTHSESCGKCVPCRLGTKQMLQILNRITKGEGRLEDIDLLLQIAATMKQGALCGLGQTAPNPVLTTIRYFRDEYEAHIKRKKCPAAVCRGLVKAPCMHTCPAGVHVPRYMRYIAAGRYSDALDVIMEKIPFPSICGYVCFHPCETKCRRGDLDDPIAVRALKRFAAERGIRRRRKRAPKAKPTGRRVAVVGSGPAGLTAAFYLGKLGHKVAVFERDTQPGGTLRTGIPGFRLPRNVIDEEIERIMKASRFSIRTNSSNISALKLLKRGYDAVLLACGAQKGLKMGIEGEDDAGVFDCLTFLKRFNSSENTNLGGRVSVIGGGSSAMDAARAALRAGAREVTVLYRRTRVEMPAAAEEVEEALEEGVNMEFLTAPTAIHRKNGALILKCIRMQPGPMDDSGRARPVPIDGSSFDKQVDAVIMAVGQAPEDTFASDCKADRGGRIQVDEDTFQTNCNGVFAAGDLVTGPASIIEAIAAGRLAACSIDRYLGGQGIIAEVVAPDKEEESGEMLEEQDAVPRIEIPKRAPKDRVADGGQVELCYSEQSALAEAARCLRCDLEQEQE
ncbi:MAG: FAD-dependent oxidoreductase [Kiritimatiellae bacterium]|nr:FAD-dependent oxidoreductase [Kiritimatiellia bacterium]